MNKTELEAFELFERVTDNVIEIAKDLQKSYYATEEIRRLKEASTDLLMGEEYTEVIRRIEKDRKEMLSQVASVAKDEQEYIDTAHKIKNPADVAPGINTGFQTIDKMTGGFTPSSYIIIAGRPKMGKTTILLWHIIHALRQGKKVLFFSIEMSTPQILDRMAHLMCGFNPDDKLRLTEQQREKVGNKVLEMYDMPLTIYDARKFSTKVEDLTQIAAQVQYSAGVDMVCIDYLQKLNSYTNHRGNDNAKFTDISNELALACQRLDAPFLVLSQLSRAVETRGGNKRPMLSDLRSSGSIEQDATEVWFVYRPEYYDITEDEEGNPTAGLIEYTLAASRFAGKFKNAGVDLTFIPQTGEIVERGKEPIIDTSQDMRVAVTAPDDTPIPF